MMDRSMEQQDIVLSDVETQQQLKDVEIIQFSQHELLIMVTLTISVLKSVMMETSQEIMVMDLLM